ncbi:MAG TPA: hypothetical protein VG056_04195 [Pirellulales bacterium]|jgi:hypothetical protein|nr:hypothetical protein [Pirellulales bacterium]
MPDGQLIVLERDGHWAAALHLELDSTRIRLFEIRSWAECWERLAQCPTALVAAELTGEGAGQMLSALSRLDREFPKAALVALADRRLAGYRDLIREAGAVHFIISPRRLGEVSELLRRRAERFPAAEAADNPTDKIRENLPWNDLSE